MMYTMYVNTHCTSITVSGVQVPDMYNNFQLFFSIIAVSLLSSTGTTYNYYDKCKNQKYDVGMAPCQKLLIQEGFLFPVY